MSKVKYPRAAALAVAKELCDLQRICDRLICAGSLRRRKLTVGDVEILYIPKFATEPDGLFDQKKVNLVDVALEEMIKSGIIAQRRNADNNLLIASAAQAKGWKWNPYGVGFTSDSGQVVEVKSERDVFEFVGLPYREPWERL